MAEMEKQVAEEKERAEDKRRGYIASLIYLLLFFLIILLPMLSYPDPPPEREGVLVSFGSSSTGGGNDVPLTQQEEYIEEETQPTSEPVQEKAEPREIQASPVQATTPREVRTSEDPNVARITKEKEAAGRKAEAEREQKRAAEAKRQAAEAEQKKFEDAKSQFGNLFGQGKGENASSGNQGDPTGDPTAKALEGTTSGRGVIGGGLDGRGVSYAPKIEDRSQKTGRVVVKVCVNGDGEVISAEYTQAGSTTTDSDLRTIAVSSAKRFKFTGSAVDRQCGTISIDFKVK